MKLKKSMKFMVVCLLLVVLCFMLCCFTACGDKPSDNNDETQNQEIDSEEESQPKTMEVKLNTENFWDYFTASVYPKTQINTLLYHVYQVRYSSSGSYGDIESPTPPTGSNIASCSYLYSVYNVQAIFEFTIKSKSEQFKFKNVVFNHLLSIQDGRHLIIYLDSDGNGKGNFAVYEERKSYNLAVDYSFKERNTLFSIEGTVTVPSDYTI